MKKIWCLPAVLTISILLSGCGAVISDEDNRVIAEYAADLLLKYDRDYQPTLVEPEAEPETDSSTESVSEETDSSSTEQKDSTEGTSEASSETTVLEVTDLAQVFGLEGVSISFSQCTFPDRYPDLEADHEVVSVDAETGYKLAVVEFDVKNQTEQDMDIDLLHRTVGYKLVVDDSNHARPMLTILTNDLGTLQSVIPAGETQKAVLIFQISEDMIDQITSLQVQITYEDEEYMIHIQ